MFALNVPHRQETKVLFASSFAIRAFHRTFSTASLVRSHNLYLG